MLGSDRHHRLELGAPPSPDDANGVGQPEKEKPGMNTGTERPPRIAPNPAYCRTVVAVTLWRKGKLCLLRRSQLVGSDTGLWHCVTGYLEPGASPEEQARTELVEETGLSADSLERLIAGGSFVLPSADGSLWTVHTFTAVARTETLTLNWEYDAYRWVDPTERTATDHVPWLSHVLAVETLPAEVARLRWSSAA